MAPSHHAWGGFLLFYAFYSLPWYFFEFYVFTKLALLYTAVPSGGTIFLLVKKDSGERHAKGLQSRPLETCFDTGERRGDVPTFLRIRRNAINAI